MGGAYASLTKVYDPVRKIGDYVYDMEETWKKVNMYLQNHSSIMMNTNTF